MRIPFPSSTREEEEREDLDIDKEVETCIRPRNGRMGRMFNCSAFTRMCMMVHATGGGSELVRKWFWKEEECILQMLR